MFRIRYVDIVFNEARFSEVWIDPHYEVKHGSYIDDELILALLEGVYETVQKHHKERGGFKYYEVNLKLEDKMYRLILVIPEDMSYIGVRNAYRRNS